MLMVRSMPTDEATGPRSSGGRERVGNDSENGFRPGTLLIVAGGTHGNSDAPAFQFTEATLDPVPRAGMRLASVF